MGQKQGKILFSGENSIIRGYKSKIDFFINGTV